MKKLIWLMVLGVIFFIGGQWLGLHLSEGNRASQTPTAAQNGSALAEPVVPTPAPVHAPAEPPDSGPKKAGSGSGTHP